MTDNLAGQLWFGAECLAAGSSIMHKERESDSMRPLAKAVTKSLEKVGVNIIACGEWTSCSDDFISLFIGPGPSPRAVPLPPAGVHRVHQGEHQDL